MLTSTISTDFSKLIYIYVANLIDKLTVNKTNSCLKKTFHCAFQINFYLRYVDFNTENICERSYI